MLRTNSIRNAGSTILVLQSRSCTLINWHVLNGYYSLIIALQALGELDVIFLSVAFVPIPFVFCFFG